MDIVVFWSNMEMQETGPDKHDLDIGKARKLSAYSGRAMMLEIREDK